MSTKITQKTLNDLEFESVLEKISSYGRSRLGKKAIRAIRPIQQRIQLKTNLYQTNEYLSSFENENSIPLGEYEDISSALNLLKVEGSFLEPKDFLHIRSVTLGVYELLRFFKKFESYYPNLYKLGAELTYEEQAVKSIDLVINRFGEVLSTASPELKIIRKELNTVRAKLSTSFDKALAHYSAQDILDDIKESVIDNQRVLAVQAKHRKKIKGSVLGGSKTGSIVFIAPEATVQLNRELQNLLVEENEEIVKILKRLTNDIRPYHQLFQAYQNYLVALEVFAAKAKYALQIGGLLPRIANQKKIFLRDAYHPLLLENNKAKNITTIPQTLDLNNEQQIIVISGPNAGGKSITLKTIGLLQVMIQSGILIPVHERSEVYFFDTILTDIGDNQSIENQLSTYSYRLKNMRTFLKKCNTNTLFLIDEFGTGSDPELGGALAEIFLEEFHKKGAYGVITTHYANLKVLADELDNVTNANMQFDEKSLEPLFKLYIGQAGSSFTFEVAQKNGIPFSLINRAKKKVEGEKIRLDKTIAKLQKERNALRNNALNLEKEHDKTKEYSENLQQKEEKIQEKLERFQELYEHQQKMLTLGRKINELSNTYFQTNNKKKLVADFMRWMTIEKSKYLEKHPRKKATPKSKKETTKKKENKLAEVKLEVDKAIKQNKRIQEKRKSPPKKNVIPYTFKVNDRVRLQDSRSVGTIDKIEKNTVTVNYGKFTTQAKLNQIELVESSKK
ncbi:DNA mismatch repair protein MutS [Flavobacteriaceae bacterium F08102]|nr:DNA mismatch repair protein MutS [Flavobacteriaceae bacterium F08102]